MAAGPGIVGCLPTATALRRSRPLRALGWTEAVPSEAMARHRAAALDLDMAALEVVAAALRRRADLLPGLLARPTASDFDEEDIRIRRR
eukprot:6510329-Alexandrium_andersonii.AAC.1